ncbi:MAG: DUF4136 domain-containing protein [Cyclobacteriaceae bacterium]
MKKSIVFLLLVSFACSSVKIAGVTNAEGFSISKYKTFSFYEVNRGGDALGPNQESNLKLIKEAIVKQLSAKGVALSGDNPDLLVNIGIVVSSEVQTVETSFANPADRTYYMGQRTYSWQAGEKEVGTYRQGTVTVHLVDPAADKLVWQGSADSVLPEKQKNIPALIEEGMAKLFQEVK